jgi:hypothetical protein
MSPRRPADLFNEFVRQDTGVAEPKFAMNRRVPYRHTRGSGYPEPLLYLPLC